MSLLRVIQISAKSAMSRSFSFSGVILCSSLKELMSDKNSDMSQRGFSCSFRVLRREVFLKSDKVTTFEAVLSLSNYCANHLRTWSVIRLRRESSMRSR